MHRSFTKTGTPAQPCVTVTDMMAHSRIDGMSEQALMLSYLSAAESVAGDHLGKCFRTQQFEVLWDGFEYTTQGKYKGALVLPVSPAYVTAPVLTYLNSEGVTTNLAAFQYSYKGTKGRILPAPGQDWPATQDDAIDSVKVVYSAGFGPEVSDVPDDHKQIIKFIAAYWYEFRVPILADNLKQMQTPIGLEGMIQSLRVN